MTSWLSELTQSTSEQNDEKTGDETQLNEKTGDETQLDEGTVKTYSEENTNEL